MRRTIALTLTLLMVAPSATAGISMTMEPVAPGSTDVRVRWEADTPGPFTLLRWARPCNQVDVAAGIPFPLDPVADAYVTGLSGGSVVLPAEMVRDTTDCFAPRSRIYQLVDASGNCSNAGIVQWLYHDDRWAVGTRHGEYIGLPARSVYVTAAALMAHLPACSALWLDADGRCPARRLVRRADGTLDGPDFALPAGCSVDVTWSDRSQESVIVGAAEVARPLRVPLQAPGGCAGTSFRSEVSLPVLPDMYTNNEILCGHFGTDWTDVADAFGNPPADGNPDTCPAGLFASSGEQATQVSQTAMRGVPNMAYRTAFLFMGRLGFTGLTDDLIPMEGLSFYSGAPAQVLVGERGDPPACRCADTDGDGDDDCAERLFGTDPLDPASFGRDTDGDGVPDPSDPCPTVFDPGDVDTDGDGTYDACDPCPADALDACIDRDGDGFDDGLDNCPDDYNPGQEDADADDIGDDCDGCWMLSGRYPDADGDGIDGACDNCPTVPPVLGSAEAGPLLVSRQGGRLSLTLDADAVEIEVAAGDLASLLRDRSFSGARCAGASRWGRTVVIPAPASDAWFLVRRQDGCTFDTFGRGAGPERAWLDDEANFRCR